MELRKIDRGLIIVAVSILIGLALRIYRLDIGLGFSDEYELYEALNFVMDDPKNVMLLTVIHTHPPLYWSIFPFFYLFLSPFFAPQILLLRIISASIGTVFIYIVYNFVKKEIGKEEAIISAVLLSITGYFVILSRIGYPEIAILVIFMLLIFYFLKFIGDITLKTSIQYGMLLTLTILFREGAVIFILSSILFLIWDKNWTVLKNKFFWMGTLFPTLIVLPVLIYAVYFILPDYVKGISLLELPAFYQLYLQRESHLMNVIPGIYRILSTFTYFSSTPVLLLFTSGVGYGLYRSEKFDKYFISIAAVFMVFFASMGKPIPTSEYITYLKAYSVEGFVDWHTMWIFIPMLLVTSRSLVHLYTFKIKILTKNKLRMPIFILLIFFLTYIIYFDLSIIDAMNDYMSKNLELVPMLKKDPRAEDIAQLFN